MTQNAIVSLHPLWKSNLVVCHPFPSSFLSLQTFFSLLEEQEDFVVVYLHVASIAEAVEVKLALCAWRVKDS